MSYDLMVFEPSSAPRERGKFMEWYAEQTKWAEDHSYQDHSVSSAALQEKRGQVSFYLWLLNNRLAVDSKASEKNMEMPAIML